MSRQNVNVTFSNFSTQPEILYPDYFSNILEEDSDSTTSEDNHYDSEEKCIYNICSGDSNYYPNIMEDTPTVKDIISEVDFSLLFNSSNKFRQNPYLFAIQGEPEKDLEVLHRFPYNNITRDTHAKPWSSSVKMIKEKIEEKVEEKYNHCTMFLLRGERDYLKLMKEKMLDTDEKSGISIYSICDSDCGITRKLVLCDGVKTTTVKMYNNSMVYIGKDSINDWYYHLPKEECGIQILLVFRTVKTMYNTKYNIVLGKGSTHNTLNYPFSDVTNLMVYYTGKNIDKIDRYIYNSKEWLQKNSS